MPDGTTLSSKSLSELEKKIANAKRELEAQRTKKVLKEKGLHSPASARRFLSARARGGMAKNTLLPVDQTKKYKKFYSPDYKVS